MVIKLSMSNRINNIGIVSEISESYWGGTECIGIVLSRKVSDGLDFQSPKYRLFFSIWKFAASLEDFIDFKSVRSALSSRTFSGDVGGLLDGRRQNTVVLHGRTFVSIR